MGGRGLGTLFGEEERAGCEERGGAATAVVAQGALLLRFRHTTEKSCGCVTDCPAVVHPIAVCRTVCACAENSIR